MNVSWNDAVTFCNELSKSEGIAPYYRLEPVEIAGGDGYRLPTEAEWEYACRAGTTTRYSSGDDPESLAGVGNVADATLMAAGLRVPADLGRIRGRDGYVFTAPVGQFRPNAFGLHDMHGNVGEWCWDPYQEDYYKRSPIDDPAGPVWASSRVIRGGSWFESPKDMRSADRISSTPEGRSFYGGFRIARSRPRR